MRIGKRVTLAALGNLDWLADSKDAPRRYPTFDAAKRVTAASTGA